MERMRIMSFLSVVFTLAFLRGCVAQTNVCGQAPLNTRIVGGQNAVVGSWPWQASIQRNNFHFCGGSLINSEWVMTAAHCFDDMSLTGLVVYLGKQNLSNYTPNEVALAVSRIVKHPNYNSKTHDNDITLLHLASPVTLNNYIQPICLASANSTFFNGSATWVTGWGNIKSGVSLPSPLTLQEVQVPVVGNRQCACLYGVATITSNMICAGLLAGGKDSCQGDSGGPLVIKQGSVWIQFGIVSFGEGCALPNYPGIYTRVSNYQTWITAQISTNQTGFATYVSSGTDSDLNANCNGLPTVVFSTVASAASTQTTTTTTTTTAKTISTTTVAPVVCGNANLNTRIGGSSSLVSSGVWPWMASLQFNGVHVCGGALISQQFVLSSASCFTRSIDASAWTVILGRLNQNGNNPNEVFIKVVNITVSNSSGDNVAVLQLGVAPNLTNYIQPICVDTGSNITAGTQCWATGWGSGAGGVSQTLQEYQASVVSCGTSSSNSICTSAITIQEGDQGGPLMCKLGQSWVHVAVLTKPSSISNSSSTVSNSTITSSSNTSSTTNATSANSTSTNSTSTNTTSIKSDSRNIQPRDIQTFTKTSSFSPFLTSVVGSLPQRATNSTNSTTTAIAPSSNSTQSSFNSLSSSASSSSFFSLTLSSILLSLLALQIVQDMN